MKDYSIAIFGSSLRDDFDKYSDKDLLIVADSYDQLKILKEEYSKGDWSISFYTYSKLEYLSEKGSLFIQHLKVEAEILIDTDGRLNNILSTYSLKDDYRYEICEAENFFQILEFVPNTKKGLAWFCDTLYVGLRNYLIFSNTEKNVFEFSFNKLLNNLSLERKISEAELNILKELRVIKRNYRENFCDEFPSLNYVLAVLEIIDNFNFINKIQIVEPKMFQRKIVKNIYHSEFSPYQKLRLIEGYYTSQDQENAELKKIISSPQFYAAKFKDEIYVSKLISTINNVRKERSEFKSNFFCLSKSQNPYLSPEHDIEPKIYV